MKTVIYLYNNSNLMIISKNYECQYKTKSEINFKDSKINYKDGHTYFEINSNVISDINIFKNEYCLIEIKCIINNEIDLVILV